MKKVVVRFGKSHEAILGFKELALYPSTDESRRWRYSVKPASRSYFKSNGSVHLGLTAKVPGQLPSWNGRANGPLPSPNQMGRTNLQPPWSPHIGYKPLLLGSAIVKLLTQYIKKDVVSHFSNVGQVWQLTLVFSSENCIHFFQSDTDIKTH